MAATLLPACQYSGLPGAANDPQLEAYLVRHNQMLANGGLGGFVPYVDVVARAVGTSPDHDVDVHAYAVMRPLVEAIIRHENGMQPYPDAVIDEGLRRAGVVPPPRTAALKVATSAAGVGAGTAGVGVIGAQLTATAQQAQLVAPEGSSVLNLIWGVVAVVGVGLTVWGLIRQARREGSK